MNREEILQVASTIQLNIYKQSPGVVEHLDIPHLKGILSVNVASTYANGICSTNLTEDKLDATTNLVIETLGKLPFG